MLFVDTSSPGGVRDWDVRRNQVHDNSRACPHAEGGGPPLSGLGIGLLGTRGVTVSANRVADNHPSEQTPLAGGLFLASSKALGGADPVGNLISANFAHRNRPGDLVYDGSGTNNRLRGNDCRRSLPPGLCG
jgi:hypothetical protein